jgi:hypothetical protein
MFDTGGWFYPVLLSIGLIVVCTAMELLSVALTDKAVRNTVNANPGFKSVGPQKAA